MSTNVTDGNAPWEYADAEIPVDAPAPESSADPRCLECGVPLVYSGRGRRPKYCDEHKKTSSGTGTKRTSRVTADVNAALSTMETGYHLLSMGLYVADRSRNADGQRADQVWDEKIPKLLDTDRLLFTADPVLTAKINKLGRQSSMGLFIGAHITALTPVLAQVYFGQQMRREERRQARAERARQASAPTGSIPMPDDPTTRYMP